MRLLHRLHSGFGVAAIMTTLLISQPTHSVNANDAFTVTIAQAAPVAAPPSNVRRVGKMYVVEGIVVVLLFGAALYSVCRASRRT